MVITTFWLKSGDFWPKLAANANKYPNGVVTDLVLLALRLLREDIREVVDSIKLVEP